MAPQTEQRYNEDHQLTLIIAEIVRDFSDFRLLCFEVFLPCRSQLGFSL